MKKLLFISTLAFTALMGCKNQSKPAESIAQKDTSGLSPLTTKIVGGAAITEDEAKLLVNTFEAHATSLYNSPITRCVWFSLDDLKAISAALEKEKAQGLGTDGLRVFFGTYPEKDLNNQAYEHPWQNTVIFISTKAAVNEKGVTYHLNYFDHPVKLGMAPYNRGELCEPDCEGADEGLQ